MCLGVLPHIHLCTTYMPGFFKDPEGDQKVELELGMVVSHHVGAGNQTGPL